MKEVEIINDIKDHKQAFLSGALVVGVLYAIATGKPNEMGVSIQKPWRVLLVALIGGFATVYISKKGK